MSATLVVAFLAAVIAAPLVAAADQEAGYAARRTEEPRDTLLEAHAEVWADANAIEWGLTAVLSWVRDPLGMAPTSRTGRLRRRRSAPTWSTVGIDLRPAEGRAPLTMLAFGWARRPDLGPTRA